MSTRAATGRRTDIGDALHGKYDQVFTLVSPSGDIVPGAFDGLYFHDTRHVDRVTLHVGGMALKPLLTEVGDGRVSSFQLTNDALTTKDGRPLPTGRLSVRRTRALADRVIEQIVLESFDGREVTLDVTLAFECHFEPVMAIRGTRQGKRGTLAPPAQTDGALVFVYGGTDGHRRTTTIRFDPPPARLDGTTAVHEVRLLPREPTTLRIEYELTDEPGAGAPEPVRSIARTPGSRPEAHRALSKALADHTHVETSNPMFDRALQRSLDDVRTLATAYGDEVFIAAGIPWFVALFGRDSCITAFEMLAWQPHLARASLEVLARLQATGSDDFRDEEPGKILHELRVGEMANTHEIPQYPYFGTVDATPLFLVLLGEYVRWTGDLDTFHALRDNVDRALAWIDDNSSRRLEGFVDYETRSSKGFLNQGWKDSDNSVVDDDGTIARTPIALVEVQGYVHHAKRLAAALFRATGDDARACSLETEAHALQALFESRFWMHDKGFYALAMQRGHRPVRAISSNPGQALFTGIASAERARSVAARLMQDDMFSGWGIRTLSATEPAYNPLDYQVGSVWPHDNALIALGLSRCGRSEEAERVFTGIYEAATRFPQFRLPEVFDGFSKADFVSPVRYPVACLPQAWAAGALPLLLQSALGLEPDALHGRLRVVRPGLPPWLDRVTLRGLRVGNVRLDFRFEVRGGKTHVNLLTHRTGLDVIVEPAS